MKYSALFKHSRLVFSLLFSVIGLWAMPAWAQEDHLRDVPEGHYAYSAVYDLIRRGVTDGFPDGTFRGQQEMTRFEVAAFLTKFTRSFNLSRGADEKLIEEFKSEVALIRKGREQDTTLAGGFDVRWRRGEGGSAADYRLRTKLEKKFGDLATLQVNLDTMDGGFDNGARELTRELLDFEGRVKLGGGTLKMSVGPGDVAHLDSGLFPWESSEQYRRPRRTIGYSLARGKTDLALDYLARSSAASGAVGLTEFSPKLTQHYPLFSLTLNPRWFQAGQGRDICLEMSAENNFGQLLVGAAKTADWPHGLFAKGTLTFSDNFRLVAQKVGSQYRQQFSYGIFDLFDRNIPDGSASLGGQFNTDLPFGFYGKLTGDYTLPGAVVTGDLRLGRRFSAAQTCELVYQGYRAATYSQALGIASSYVF